MPIPDKVTIKGKRYYYLSAALKLIGISRSTYFRYIKENKIKDVTRRDSRKWRLLSEADIEKIRSIVYKIEEEQQYLEL